MQLIRSDLVCLPSVFLRVCVSLCVCAPPKNLLMEPDFICSLLPAALCLVSNTHQKHTPQISVHFKHKQYFTRHFSAVRAVHPPVPPPIARARIRRMRPRSRVHRSSCILIACRAAERAGWHRWSARCQTGAARSTTSS